MSRREESGFLRIDPLSLSGNNNTVFFRGSFFSSILSPPWLKMFFGYGLLDRDSPFSDLMVLFFLEKERAFSPLPFFKR